MINETVPVYLLGRFGPVIQTMTAMGYLLVLGMGRGLPDADYDPDLQDNPLNEKAK